MGAGTAAARVLVFEADVGAVGVSGGADTVSEQDARTRQATAATAGPQVARIETPMKFA